MLVCREVTGGLVPAAVNAHYKRGGSPVLPSVPECNDSHELETLMSTDRCESAHLPEEASEDQRLMLSAPGDEEDLPPSDTKVKKDLYDGAFFFLFKQIGLFFSKRSDSSCHFSQSVALLLFQAAWNGSVSHNWGNRITRYRDTITEDSPALINGAVTVFRTDNAKVNEYTMYH